MAIGYTWTQVQGAMTKGLSRAIVALFIFILIGMLVGSWIDSGTVPALIYYGLDLLNPVFFLPATLILCSMMSLATGSCWGTASTIGLALMGIGQSLGVPLPIVAGAVVSGSVFGDKMSPASDTTNLASISAEVDLYEHIKAMSYTSIPAYLIALILYAVIGLQYGESFVDVQQIEVIKDTLSTQFEINYWLLSPIIVLLILNMAKVQPLPSMMAGIIVANIVSLVIQGTSFSDVLTVLNSGYSSETGVDVVDKLLSRGGIQSMMWTFSLALLALSLGGILDEMKFLEVVVERIIERIESLSHMVSITVVSGVLGNMALGENYLTTILMGRLFRGPYAHLGLQKRMLSRCVEEGVTLSAPLIPWTTSGAFFAVTLGMNNMAFLPYSFFNILNPIISIVLAYCGVFIFKNEISQVVVKKQSATKSTAI